MTEIKPDRINPVSPTEPIPTRLPRRSADEPQPGEPDEGDFGKILEEEIERGEKPTDG